MKLTGMVTIREEFLYPDSLCGRLPEELQITMAGNGRPGIQLILETSGKKVNFFLKGKGFCGEWYEMKDIPVEYNTGDGVSQGGAMVLETPPGEKPDYVTRLAPFRVYDCLCRTDSGEIPVKNRKAAAVSYTHL